MSLYRIKTGELLARMAALNRTTPICYFYIYSKATYFVGKTAFMPRDVVEFDNI